MIVQPDALPRWPILAFAVAALSCGWVGITLDRAAATPTGQEGPGLLLWLVAPLVTMITLRVLTGGWSRLGLRPRVAAAWRRYVVAAALPLTIGGTLAGVAYALGGARLTGDLGTYLALGATLLGASALKNVFEEFAWRGYLTAELAARRVRDLPLYLIVAGVWGLWHLPYYHALLDPSLMAKVLPLPGIWFGLWGCLAIGAMAVTLVELFQLSGSVWVPLVMHTVFNAFCDTLQTSGTLTMDIWASWLFSPTVGVFSAVAYLVVGLTLRGVRLRRTLR